MNLETHIAKGLAAADGGGIDLAHLLPFNLGSIEVVPAARELRRADGTALTIQPLAMRVLIALAENPGETLSRDDLVCACWSQRVVGDDAVHRIISTLRRDLARLSEDTLRIETIPKVGYRLLFDKEPSVDASGDGGGTAVSSPPHQQRSFAPLAAIGAVVIAGVLVWNFASFVKPADAATTRIGVEPVSTAASDPRAARFAGDLTGDLARLANAASGVSVVDRTGQSTVPANTDYVVRISVEREGSGLAATARMVATRDNSVFWSRRFIDEGANVPRLRERVAVNAAGMIRCGLEKSAGQIDDPVSLKLFFSVCDAFQNGDAEVARSFALQLVEREPDSALGWGCLAQAALFGAGDAENGSPAARAKIERYARRALAIDPQDPRAILALIEFDRGELPALEILERGLNGNSGTPEMLKAYSVALHNAGYVRDSVPPALRALARDPTSRYSYELVVRRLLAAGQFDEARLMQERAERLWPGNPETLEHRARLLLYWPDPRKKLVNQDIPDDAHLAPLGAEVIRWRANPAAIDPTAIDRRAEALARAYPPAAWHLASAMAIMNRPDRALAWLQRAPKTRTDHQWSILFAPHAAALRRDPRFFRAMADLGLVDLWVKRGQWPDFCAEPGLRYSCVREAAKRGAEQMTSKS